MKASKFLVSTVTTIAVVGAIAMAYAQTGADTSDTTGAAPSSKMNSSAGMPDSNSSNATGAISNNRDNMSDERAARSDRN